MSYRNVNNDDYGGAATMIAFAKMSAALATTASDATAGNDNDYGNAATMTAFAMMSTVWK